jgi:sulfoxide reductase catalytic subunit YedY
MYHAMASRLRVLLVALTIADMGVKRSDEVRGSEITDRKTFMSRRAFLAGTGTAIGAVAAGVGIGTWLSRPALGAAAGAPHGRKLDGVVKSPFSTDETPNPWEHVTGYNNYYEFGVDKDDPARYAGRLKTEPWTVSVEGECAKPASYHLEDILKGQTLEERIYRHRCVEGWSMVIPWVGFPLATLIKRAEPTSKAKYVELTTLRDPSQMPGQRSPVLRWPYTEGLRMDEAMHPLAILAVGVYGEVLPNQNGAPLRLVVPWKYGFKSIKAIVRVRFTERQPNTAWMVAAPEYYGFYSNVNPGRTGSTFRDQRAERRLGEFTMRRTLMFNGYADQVAGLYTGMDLARNY